MYKCKYKYDIILMPQATYIGNRKTDTFHAVGDVIKFLDKYYTIRHSSYYKSPDDNYKYMILEVEEKYKNTDIPTPAQISYMRKILRKLLDKNNPDNKYQYYINKVAEAMTRIYLQANPSPMFCTTIIDIFINELLKDEEAVANEETTNN